MKETVNVSIASQAFTIDVDAWRMLSGYLDNIRDRLEPDDAEALVDIESRIADIFRESLPSPIMVVTASLVRRVMEQIGSPEIFGTPHHRSEAEDNASSGSAESAASAPLRRSRDERVLAGICGGIAVRFGWDPAVVRLVTVLLMIFMGLSVWVYIILWLVIPAESKN